MDYESLRVFRHSLEAYYKTTTTSPAAEPAPIPESLLHATRNLPPKEVIHELSGLPKKVARLLVVAQLCDSPALRRAVFSSDLLEAPKQGSIRYIQTWYKALNKLLRRWERLDGETLDEGIRLNMQQLRERVEKAIPRRQDDVELPLATLLITADTHLRKIVRLKERISEAVSLLSDSNEKLDTAKDALQEMVESIWAQIRSEFKLLSSLKNENVTGHERDDMVTRIEESFAQLRELYDFLVRSGLQLPALEVPLGDGRGNGGEESDDAWEDPVQLDHMDGSDDEDEDMERADFKPKLEQDGIAAFLSNRSSKTGSDRNQGRELPAVQDWVAVMKGKEGQDMNRHLLDELERGSAHPAIDNQKPNISDARGTGNRGPTRSFRGSGTNKNGAKTARQRLSAALGIRKRKKKTLLE